MRKNRSYFKRVGIFYRSARLTWTPVKEEEEEEEERRGETFVL